MQEIWKDIEGYEGCYQVSNLGRLKSLERTVKGNNGGVYVKKEKILTPTINSSGYYHTILRKDGRNVHVYIHRLVAQTFIPNPDNLQQINHISEDKTNNRVDNLEWCSAKYNTNYGTANERRRETLKQNPYFKNLNLRNAVSHKKIICIETNEIFNSAKELSNILGVDIRRIRYCCKRFIKSSINNLHYKYA